MQPIKNGLYWVWWPTTKKDFQWFIVRVRNGHATFLESENHKVKATEIAESPYIMVREPKYDPDAYLSV